MHFVNKDLIPPINFIDVALIYTLRMHEVQPLSSSIILRDMTEPSLTTIY